MPAFTPLRQHPFPIETDLQNVASAIEALARSVDNVTGSETLRRYPSVAARDSVNPIPQEGQRCYCVVGAGAGNGMQFVGRGGQWYAIGLTLLAARSGVLPITADSAWQSIPWTTNQFDVANSLNVAGAWTAPFLGMVRVYAGATLVMGPTGDTFGDFHGALGIGYLGVVRGGDVFRGRFAHVSLRAHAVLSVNPGTQISVDTWVNAPGVTKSLHFSNGDVTGFSIEYV